jgi:hypothetical protein
VAEEKTLDELLAELVVDTPDVKEKGGEYARDGVVFAVRPSAGAMDLHLGPDIAEAAMRTPHTSPSPRGEDWVRLETPDWSAASDRLEAWYRVAWRLAAKRA